MYGVPVLIGGLGTLFVGRLSILELISMSWFLSLGGYKHLPMLFHRNFAHAGLFYMTSFALFLSDIINSSSIDNMAKGVGAYFIFPTTLLFLCRSFSANQLWLVLLSSSMINALRSPLTDEIGFTQESFKFGFSTALVFIILSLSILVFRLFASFSSVTIVTYLSALLIAVLGLWGNLRLLSLCALIALAVDQFCLFPALRVLILKRRNRLSRLVFFSLAFPFLLIATSLIAGYFFYFIIDLLPSDLVSQDALDKTVRQSQGSLGVLFGGRSEIFSSFLAWTEKPIFGWGSWAADPNNTFFIAGKILMNKFGYDIDIGSLINYIERVGTYGFIPTHSALLNGLVWSGAIGFIPLYLVTCQLAINLFELGASNVGYSYPFLFVYTLSLWTFLFSPFGYSTRVSLAILMSVALSCSANLPQASASSVRLSQAH